MSSNISWHSLGEGFTWETQDRVRDEKLVQEAWQLAKEYIKNKSYKLIILDEINIATKLGYLAPEEIITFLNSLNNRKNHIVLTGRGYSLQIKPYDLRHAWAVRTIFYDLPDTVAARMMGHSVSLHTQTYHHWITKRDQQQAVNNALLKVKQAKNI